MKFSGYLLILIDIIGDLVKTSRDSMETSEI